VRLTYKNIEQALFMFRVAVNELITGDISSSAPLDADRTRIMQLELKNGSCVLFRYEDPE
jgi:hypothetical protein